MNRTTIQSGIILFIAIILNSCISDGAKKQNKGESATGTALNLDKRLEAADSLVIVFYKDPYGEDSLRYTRYYTQISVTDISGIDILQKQLAQQYTKEENRRKCRGDGKIWCYAKGRIFQTLYFSTLCNNQCCYVYLIKDGIFYYTPISQAMIAWLKALKPLTIELQNEGATTDDSNN